MARTTHRVALALAVLVLLATALHGTASATTAGGDGGYGSNGDSGHGDDGHGDDGYGGHGGGKVVICHRTDSKSNPYVRLVVDRSAVDGRPDRGDHRSVLAVERGDDGRDHDDDRGDHYLNHRGPIGPLPVGTWGDIIPPVPPFHTGLNWTSAGIAIYKAKCKVKPGPTTTTTTTTTTSSTTTTVISNCEDYTPTGMTVSPNRVNPGQTITVAGNGTPGTTVVVTLRRPNGQSVGSPVSVVVPPSGQWSVQITLPANTPLGALDVIASVPPCTNSTTVRIVVSNGGGGGGGGNGGGPSANVAGATATQDPAVLDASAEQTTVTRSNGATVASGTLARTGGEQRSLAIWGVVLLAVGAALVLAGRRRLSGSHRTA